MLSTAARRGDHSSRRRGRARSAAALTTAGRARREGPGRGGGNRGAGEAGSTSSAAARGVSIAAGVRKRRFVEQVVGAAMKAGQARAQKG